MAGIRSRTTPRTSSLDVAVKQVQRASGVGRHTSRASRGGRLRASCRAGPGAVCAADADTDADMDVLERVCCV